MNCVQETATLITSLLDMDQTDEVIKQLATAYDTQTSNTDSFFYNINALMTLSILSISYFIWNIQEMIYSHLRGVFVQGFTAELMLNLTNSVLVIYWVMNHYCKYAINLNDYPYYQRAYVVIDRMNNDNYFNIKLWNASNIALQFTRVVFSLQVSKTFGPMVKILGSMLLDVTIFMLLFAALFLIFNAIGQLVFSELPAFSSPIQTAITLFSACLGNFDYTIFNNCTEVSPNLGYIFLTIFQLFTMIMLLNFLIAILSNTYANLNDVQIGLYLRKVLFLRQRGGYDSHYSAIIFAIPPLNIVAFVLLPFISYWRSRKFNKILLLIMYIPIGFTAFLLFTLSQLIMMPITYILILLSKTWNVPIKPIFGAKDLFLRITDLTLFIFFGGFLLLFWVSLDFINYSFKLLDYKIVYINTHEEDAQEKVNQHMDGSIRFKETERRKQNGEPPLENEEPPRSRSLNRVLNPVKEGLADNTLRILKAWLKTIKDRHFKAVGPMDKNAFKYIPTVCILFEIKDILMIQEQINAILYGVNYAK